MQFRGAFPATAPTDVGLAVPVWRRPLALAVLAQIVLWGIIPLGFVTSLHQDTLEIIYWGRELALGYYKHPPLPTWLLDLVVHPGVAPIAAVLLVGIACVAITAAYVHATVRLFAPASSAALATLAYLVTRAATFQSLQVNHNSLLIPIWAALLFYALRYFEQRRLVDALWAGLAAALSVFVKYEILFLIEALVLLVAVTPAYRPVVRDWRSHLAVFVACVLVTPHVIWALEHRDETLRYALETRNIESALDLLDSLNHFVVGHLLVLVLPAILLGAARLAGWRFTVDPAHRRLAWLVGVGPSVFLGLMSLVTLQIIRDGWVDPLAPSFAIGLGLALRLEPPAGVPAEVARRGLALRAIALSSLQLVGFFLLLLVRAQFGLPVAAYDLDSRKMAADVETYWAARHAEPLRCIVASTHLVPTAPVLWLHKRVHVVDLGAAGWSRPDQIEHCVKSGAVLIMLDPAQADRIPQACLGSGEPLRVASPLSGGRAGWNVTLFDLPPGGCAAKG